MTDATESQPGISITRVFDAPPEAVFAAWTEPAQFGHWFGGAGTTVDRVVMDVQPGGEWSARMIVGEGMADIEWRGAFVVVEPPRQLVLTLADRPGDEYELVTVVLAALEGRTEMTFTQTGGHMDAAGYARAEEGWRAFFDAMTDLVVASADRESLR
jgi:uncharacterized protein YndB with AHSA1/START domain